MTATLVCSGLRKSFGDRVAVDGVEFSIAAGETYGLLGPNGAGKTTTISMVCGLLTRDAGEILLEGRPFDTTSIDAKASIGLVPQEIAIYPDLSANENLAFFGRLYGLHDPELSDRVAEVLETVGLQDRANDRTSEFSGGMKRRLNIGLGLLHRPQLLVLDEPTPSSSSARVVCRSCTRRITWRRRNASATVWGSSTRGDCSPRAPGESSSRASGRTIASG